MNILKYVTIFLASMYSFSSMLCAAEGALDTSFNSPNGYVLWDGGNGYDRGRDIAVQSDGKLVVTGYHSNGTDDDLFVIRYNSDGSLDTGFGTNGLYAYDGGNGNDCGFAIAIQADGSILAAGDSQNGTDYDMVALRLTTDGVLDNTFGTQGIVNYDSGQGDDQAIDIVIQSDGYSIVAGQVGNGSDAEVAVWRLNGDGALDTSFGTNGIARYDRGSGDDAGLRVALQADGKIVVTGSGHNGSDYDIILMRFDTDGTLDTSFGTNGVRAYDGGDYDRGYGLAIQTDGKILVSGVRSTVPAGGVDYDIPLIRYNSNGSLDTGFGQNGLALFSSDIREQSYDVVIQADGKILVVGHSGDNDWALVVLRFNTDGGADTDFGTSGVYRYDSVGTDWGYGIVIDANGRIVVTGQSSNGTDDDVIILRLDNSDDDSDDDDEGGDGCFINNSF